METVRHFLGTESKILFSPFPRVLGLETAVVNSFSPGDTVVVPVFGGTGECWARIAEAFGLSVIRLGGYGGEAPSCEDLRLLLWTQKRAVRGVLVPHVERDSGLSLNLEAFGKVCRSFGVLFVAEVGDAFGVFPLELDAWGVDLAVVSEPLSFRDVSLFVVGERAWEARERARCPRFSLDFSRIREWAQELPSPLGERLKFLRAMGWEDIQKQRLYLREALCQGARALGFGVTEGNLFPLIVILELPEGVEREELLFSLRRRGVLAGPVPRRDRTLWVRCGDTLSISEIHGILEVLRKGVHTAETEVDGG
ncbi:MAG: alanine--glyoxylate aminotransferase family protein [Candidatus Caldatribacterium sp.]|nr:alanine--glyoxylate aminotransferase family protein [Candidatus Caldatribacterium sp.]